MRNVATTIQWIHDLDGSSWGLETGSILDENSGDLATVAIERETDIGTWSIDFHAPERRWAPDEARQLAAAILAAATEAEVRNGEAA